MRSDLFGPGEAIVSSSQMKEPFYGDRKRNPQANQG
jgi:hypothetical protein